MSPAPKMFELNHDSSVLSDTTAPLGLRVVRIDPHCDIRWKNFIQSHPKATIYHDPAWIRVLEREHEQKAEHLACEDWRGKLVAVLPLLRTEGAPFGLGGPRASRRLSS